MEDTYKSLYNRIKVVLEKNIDAYKGYLKSADIAKKSEVKSFYNQKALSIASFNDKLLSELNYTFDFPHIEGSFSGMVQRAWMDTKGLLFDTNDKSMLKETLKSDKIALEEYQELLRYPSLPLAIRYILREQTTIIILDSLTIEQLIDSM